MYNDNYLYYPYSNTYFIRMLYYLHIVYSCLSVAGHVNGGRWSTLLLASLVAASISTTMSGMQFVYNYELCLKKYNNENFTTKAHTSVSCTLKIQNHQYVKSMF